MQCAGINHKPQQMKALKIIGIILLVLFGLFLLVPAFLPSEVTTRGEIYINAPASSVFNQVNSMQKWAEWSPFERADTTMNLIYRGAEQGEGSEMFWTNHRNDSGVQVIIESIPYSFLKMELNFFRGGKAYSTWTFDDNDSTHVVWKVFMPELGYPLGRLMGLIMPAMMKPMHTNGLNNLKKLVEANPAEAKVVDMPAMHVLVVKDSADMNGIGNILGKCYGEILVTAMANNIEITGAPFCIYYSWDETKLFVMEPGIPVSQPLATKPNQRVQYRLIPPGKYALAVHYGPYDKSSLTHLRVQDYLNVNNIHTNGYPWEVYVTDPESTPDTNQWMTEIRYPVK